MEPSWLQGASSSSILLSARRPIAGRLPEAFDYLTLTVILPAGQSIRRPYTPTAWVCLTRCMLGVTHLLTQTQWAHISPHFLNIS